MNSLTPPSATATAEQISDAWIAKIAEILHRDGYDVRASPRDIRPPTEAEIKCGALPSSRIEVGRLTIEVAPRGGSAWARLMHEQSGYTFATAEDRDAVLERIQRRAGELLGK